MLRLLGFFMLAGLASAQTTLTVMSPKSFSIDKKLIAQFEQTNKAKVNFVKSASAGVMLNQVILTDQTYIADVLYGIDNSLIIKARSANILQPYISPLSRRVPAKLRLSGDGLLSTVAYGYVNLNYDRAYFEKNKLALPNSLDDLKKPEYAKLTVLQSPATSSTGLAFLLATVQHYGEAKAWDWWKDARNAGMKTDSSWSDAYYKDFSKNGGEYPIVLSYSSSPAAEVYYADGYNPEKMPSSSPTANIFLEGGTWLQVEGASILKNAKEPELAKKFIDFLLSNQVQESVATSMWVYPAVAGIKLDPVYKFASQPQPKPSGSNLSSNPQRIVDAWVKNVLRAP